MAGGLCKFQEVVARNGGGGVIFQRVEIDRIGGQQGGVNDEGDLPAGIIHQRKGGDRAGTDAQHFKQVRLAGKGQALATDQLVQTVDADRRIAQRRDQHEAASLVLEEEILGMPAGQAGLDRLALIHREDRRMIQR